MTQILKKIVCAALISAAALPMAYGADNPKREFRGAWLHVIGPVSYAKMGTEKAKQYIIDQLDKLQTAGCNAVIFQVRPMADALYESKLEPWSAYLTGKRGKAPSPMWDPMEFTINEAHKRGMEFHAWLNPYRVSVTAETFPADHLSKKHPERFFRYDGKLFFDPAYQENRDFISEIVKDIVTRYDVDAIHMDDYFYPYQTAGTFNADAASYAKFGKGQDKGDWRRHNVDLLIEQLHKTIHDTKPWVRFGISPFGIWRNKKNDPRGSDTNGLQNYDGLYADILLWDEKGWVDYVAPQLYWELDHKAASSRKLVKWWNDNIHNAQLYIGQDVQRTMNQRDTQAGRPNELQTKIELSRELDNVDGNVWWHSYWVTDNYKGARDLLAQNFQSTLALPPAFGDNVTVATPRDVRLSRRNGKVYIDWLAPQKRSNARSATDVVKYVVYEFYDGEDHDYENAETIIAITPYTSVELGSDDAGGRTFAVTSVDRMNRESKAVTIHTK